MKFTLQFYSPSLSYLKFKISANMSHRSSSYSIVEDKLLCQCYVAIAQDPIIGIQQTCDRLWARVEDAYNKEKPPQLEQRGARSLQCRYLIIEKAVRKLLGCIRQVENLRPSGASESDILVQAKELLSNDPKFKKGFKFDHVWTILKDFEKFNDSDGSRNTTRHFRRRQGPRFSSSSDNQTPQSPDLSFSVNLEDNDVGDTPTSVDDIGGSSHGRPIGVKKAKLKKKAQDDSCEDATFLTQQNSQVVELMKKAEADRAMFYELEKEKLKMQEKELKMQETLRDDKILEIDTESIKNPAKRLHIENLQIKIMQKRAAEDPPAQSSSSIFGSYFGNIGGGGTDLPPY